MNSAKPRLDGRGDPWANAHRSELPGKYLMTDVDGLFGYLNFYKESQESLFIEYEPDRHRSAIHYENFAVVALLDRKSSRETALAQTNRLSRNFYCLLARTIGHSQPVEPMFFYICGTHSPWLALEINIHSGQPLLERPLYDGQWLSFYRDSGLDRIRSILSQHFDSTRESHSGITEGRGNQKPGEKKHTAAAKPGFAPGAGLA